jgi:hypothetical protein
VASHRPQECAGNFFWVCLHEGQLNDFKVKASNGQFEQIRRTYHDKQGRNPNAKNILNGFDNSTIKALIDQAR